MAEPVFDATTSFLGGQDVSKEPDEIAPNRYFKGVNVRCEKGALKPRWALHQKRINFPEGTLSIDGSRPRSYRNIFESGKFQLVAPYVNGTEYGLIIVVAGIIFFWNQRTYDLILIPIAGGSYLNETKPRLNWAPASRFLVIFDFPAYPVIIENGAARRANPADMEIPISNIGAYNQTRLFIGNAGNEFTAGDPAGDVLTPDAPITFIEVYPGGPYFNQFFQLSTNYGNDPITAMAFLQMVDTSTGIGSLLVSTQKAIYSYLAQIPRTDWEASTFGTVFVFNNGIAGQRSFVNVNSDIFYISSDGQIRAASMSRDEQKKWSKTPLSREVENWLKYNEKDLITLGSMNYFNNKIFATANPYRVEALTVNGAPTYDFAYGGFVVLGTENISQLGQAGDPAWDGLWTGVRPMDTAVNDDRFFVISKDEAFQNSIYEFIPDSTLDFVRGEDRYINSIVYTREYDFQNEFLLKQLKSVQPILENVQGDFKFVVAYKPDHGSYFAPWVDFDTAVPWRTCDLPDASNVNGLLPQSFGYMQFGSPDNRVCNPVVRQPYPTFQKVQLRIELTGKYWELHSLKLSADAPNPQNQTESICGPFPSIEMPAECFNEWDIPEINLCRSYQT